MIPFGKISLSQHFFPDRGGGIFLCRLHNQAYTGITRQSVWPSVCPSVPPSVHLSVTLNVLVCRSRRHVFLTIFSPGIFITCIGWLTQRCYILLSLSVCLSVQPSVCSSPEIFPNNFENSTTGAEFGNSV